MWHAGNGTFANLPMLPSISQWEASSTSLVTIFLALSIALLFILPSSSDDKIPKLNGLHLVTAWRFLTKRYDFFREHFGKTGVNIFSFHILQVGSCTCVQYGKLKFLSPASRGRGNW